MIKHADHEIAILRFVVCLAVLTVAVACYSPTPAGTSTASGQPTTQAVGIPITQVRPQLYAAGQPSVGDWTGLKAMGITTVVNLRTDSELPGRDEASEVRRAGMRYVQIPVADAADLNPDTARTLHRALVAADGPVLLHCASANRVGGLLALMAAHEEGMPHAQALALGRRAGMRSTEQSVLARLQCRERGSSEQPASQAIMC